MRVRATDFPRGYQRRPSPTSASIPKGPPSNRVFSSVAPPHWFSHVTCSQPVSGPSMRFPRRFGGVRPNCCAGGFSRSIDAGSRELATYTTQATPRLLARCTRATSTASRQRTETYPATAQASLRPGAGRRAAAGYAVPRAPHGARRRCRRLRAPRTPRDASAVELPLTCRLFAGLPLASLSTSLVHNICDATPSSEAYPCDFVCIVPSQGDIPHGNPGVDAGGAGHHALPGQDLVARRGPLPTTPLNDPS